MRITGSGKATWLPASLGVLAALLLVTAAAAEEALFVSREVGKATDYTKGIEGPAVDAAGVLYVANFGKLGSIEKLKPGAAQAELFVQLPDGNVGNGIRFDRQGRMYVADYAGHQIFVFEAGQTARNVYLAAHFHQPNDLAIADDGTLYASDPCPHCPGRIWQITRLPNGKGHGKPMSSERAMGRSNGLDLSPDGKTLYVSESDTRQVWAYRIEGTKLTAPRLLRTFGKSDLDGLRTDIDGRIFVVHQVDAHTPPEVKGSVAVLAPDGTLVREVPVLGKGPTNLAFGGADGKTVFVTQADGGSIEAFRVDRPGREYCQLAANPPCPP